MKLTTMIVSCAVLMSAAPGFLSCCDAEVIGAAPHGFRIETVKQISGSRDRVYRAIVDEIGLWWHADHTYSGDSRNLYLEAAPKGWFGEKLSDGFVRHMEVVSVRRGTAIRMTGGLGPLQEMGVSGTLSILLDSDGSDTRLKLAYAVSGYSPQGLAELAPLVDSVLNSQLKALARHVKNTNK